MPLRTLTTQQGVRNPDGTPAANISISYRLTKAFATSDRVFVPVTGAVTTDVNGVFSAQLAVPDSGSIGYSIQLPNAVIPALLSDGVGDIYLETLVATAEASGSIDYFQTLIDGADQRRADGDTVLQTQITDLEALVLPPYYTSTVQWWDRYIPDSFYQDAAATVPAATGDPARVWRSYEGIDATTNFDMVVGNPVTLLSNGVQFDGIGSVLNAAIGARTNPETIYVVTTPAAGNGTILDGSNANLAFGLLVPNITSFVFIVGGSLFLTNTVADSLQRYVLCATLDGASSSLTANTAVVAGSVNATTATGLRFGARGGSFPSTYFTGTIASVLRYPNVAHTAAQRDSVIGWLARRHVVTL